MKPVNRTPAAESLSGELRALRTLDYEIDMQPFEEDVTQTEWRRADRFIREHIAGIQKETDRLEQPDLHYFGLTHVPLAVAFGAHWGDERTIHLHDLDRKTGTWV